MGSNFDKLSLSAAGRHVYSGRLLTSRQFLVGKRGVRFDLLEKGHYVLFGTFRIILDNKKGMNHIAHGNDALYKG